MRYALSIGVGMIAGLITSSIFVKTKTKSYRKRFGV